MIVGDEQVSISSYFEADEKELAMPEKTKKTKEKPKRKEDASKKGGVQFNEPKKKGRKK